MPLVDQMCLGYKLRKWKVRRPCNRDGCTRQIRRGYVHPKDTYDPPWNALCVPCYVGLFTSSEEVLQHEVSRVNGR